MGGALGHVISASCTSIRVARRESRVVLGLCVAAPVDVDSCLEVIETQRLFALTAVDHTWVSRLDHWIQDNLDPVLLLHAEKANRSVARI